MTQAWPLLGAHCCRCSAGVQGLLRLRRFQAGFKLWLACTLALVVAVLLALHMPGLPPSITMYGFMALVFTLKERVESSAEMVGELGTFSS